MARTSRAVTARLAGNDRRCADRGMLWPAPTPYPESVELPIPLRRLAYRCAYAVLSVYRSVAKPALRGVKCVLVDSDRILLVRHTYGPHEWDFPGGGLKRNESPLSAARREMREELGVDIDTWRAIGDRRQPRQHTKSTMHCF